MLHLLGQERLWDSCRVNYSVNNRAELLTEPPYQEWADVFRKDSPHLSRDSRE